MQDLKPTRSVLSVPGHRQNMHAKAAKSGADSVMLDLEDSVPIEEKFSAREKVIESIKSLDWQGKAVTFRVNALDTPYGYRDLLEVAEGAGAGIDAVVIPKIDHPGDVQFAARLLNGIEKNIGLNKKMGIEASIETARGLEQVREIAAADPRVCRLVFGIVDYQVSIGARLVSLSGHGEQEEDIYPGHRWNFAMSRIVMAAKAYGLAAIDAPYGNFKDPKGLKRASSMASALGFDGKWVIHPDQIDIVNQVFSPTAEEIERAKKVMAAYKEAESEGKGAVSVDGRMVDGATIRLASRMLKKVEKINLENKG